LEGGGVLIMMIQWDDIPKQIKPQNRKRVTAREAD
jgi:hypothetical protein